MSRNANYAKAASAEANTMQGPVRHGRSLVQVDTRAVYCRDDVQRLPRVRERSVDLILKHAKAFCGWCD